MAKPPVHAVAGDDGQWPDPLFARSDVQATRRHEGRDSDEYRRALQKRTALAQLIVVMDDQKLDALAYPTIRRKPARINDPQGGSTCQLSASTGFPAISMPAGFTGDGLPVGVELLGRAFDDAKLVSLPTRTQRRRIIARRPHERPPRPTSERAPDHVASHRRTASVSAKFTFDPSTSELTYTVTSATEILAATLHRSETNGNGPAIFLPTPVQDPLRQRNTLKPNARSLPAISPRIKYAR